MILPFCYIRDRQHSRFIPDTTGYSKDFKDLLTKNIYDHRLKEVYHVRADYLNQLITDSAGRIGSRIIKEILPGVTKTLTFPRNHRFFEIFDEKIQKMVTAGIINHFAEEDYKNLLNAKNFSKSKLDEVKPLNLEHLEAGFVVWLVTLVFPIVAFIMEWIVTLKNLIVFKYIYLTFIKAVEKNAEKRGRKIFLMEIELAKKKLFEVSENNQIEIKCVNDVLSQTEKTQIEENSEIKENNNEKTYDDVVVVEF